ncbi:MAG: hypothetical protein V5A38_08390 [Halolamina sp.]|uniref:hypothetical protein n=1 Tax=Halolamina sp. TaxID=1940283 RepID=UPI002FC391C2
MTDELTGVEAELRSNAISVERLELGDPIELTYTTAFPGASVNHGEIGRALTSFIDLFEDELETRRVEGTVLRSDSDVQGEWHAEADWFEALADYRISETEFSARVLDTLEEP